MILETPRDRMRGDYDCGAAALKVVYGFYQKPFPEEYYALSNPARGMAPETVEAALRAICGGTAWGNGWTISDLEHHIGMARPVMVLVSVQESSDHWVVVRGFSGNNVYYHDPAYGRRFTSRKKWLDWWKGPANNAYDRFGLVGWPI